jgi:simple sugar transport system ATP-binding protein
LRSSDLVIAMNPTRGLDVGAIEFVYEQIERQKSRKKAILLISTELSEILRLSDRIAVLFQGRLMGIVERKEATVEQLGRLMAGISAGKDGNRNEEA